MMVFIVHAPTTMLFQTIVVHFDFTGLCRCQIRTWTGKGSLEALQEVTGV